MHIPLVSKKHAMLFNSLKDVKLLNYLYIYRMQQVYKMDPT